MKEILNSQLLINAAYLVAGVLFILSLRGLSSQVTARRGNLYGVIGMVIAIAVTITTNAATGGSFHQAWMLAVFGGGVVGAVMAARVGMTQMPERSASCATRSASRSSSTSIRRTRPTAAPWRPAGSATPTRTSPAPAPR